MTTKKFARLKPALGLQVHDSVCTGCFLYQRKRGKVLIFWQWLVSQCIFFSVM